MLSIKFVFNSFSLSLSLGATWGPGPQKRVSSPRFIAKTICPAQHPNHCAATRHSTALFKLHNPLKELWVRRSRGAKSEQDWFILTATYNKIIRRIISLHVDVPWLDIHSLSLLSIQAALNWVQQAIHKHTQQIKKKESLGGSKSCSNLPPKIATTCSITFAIRCKTSHLI